MSDLQPLTPRDWPSTLTQTNRQKTHAGNFIYGDVTLVINPLYKDKMFVAPFDTGAFSPSQPTTPLGTLDDFWHLIEPHLKAYNSYDLANIFLRWYGGGPKLQISDFFYFEVEFSGNAWLPESLHYVIAYYNGLWGREEGSKLQKWLKVNKRPLIWAAGDDSGE